MSETQAEKKPRPLSPHLQVYKLPLTAKTSILHRLTGIALSLGTILVAIWLVAAASGEDAYNVVHDFLKSPLGTLMIFGWSAALFYHLSNGIRHLFWDLGYLLKKEDAMKASSVVLVSTVILTASAWYCATYNTQYPKDAPAKTQHLVEAFIDEGAPQ